jgi:hypothetical protein
MPLSHGRSSRWLCLALFAPLVLAGCSGGKGTVKGKVSYKGTLLKGGNVTFLSTAGKQSISCAINEDGSYTAEGVPAGPVKILVETASLKPQATQGARSYSPPPGQKAPEGYLTGMGDNSKRYTEIPEMYGDPEKTDQLYTVTTGTQEKNIELTK